MGFRFTGFSTPFIGANWEYTDEKEVEKSLAIHPDQKIKVFISSICGDKGKYDRVRAELKALLEDTKLVDVYLFEQEEASTLTAEEHYLWTLEESHVCIFLIDNSDGVTPGVQREIDTAKRCNIKSLFYFCDETTKEQTTLEKSLMGAKFAKSKSIHRFDDLSRDGAQALINDIILIYIHYCKGRLTKKPTDTDETLDAVELAENPAKHPLMIPKTVIDNVNKSKEYLLRKTLGFYNRSILDKNETANEIDEWVARLLSILFDANSIKNINISMFLDCIKGQQDELFFDVVSIRWQAIQAYYIGDVVKCIEHLQTALSLAKENNLPSWVINDILIDIRNQQGVLNTINNRIGESSAQKELNKSEEDVYYPVLDRIHDSLQQKYIEGLYKKKTTSPYSVTFGYNFNAYGELLASSIIVALYNGSLTHILLFYNKIRDFIFYMCCKFDDWRFRKELLKYAIFLGNEKEVKGVKQSYPEVLNEMNASDALEIIQFCNNHPIPYRRFSSQLLALGTIGYYLSDSDFESYSTQAIGDIKAWLNDANSVISAGHHIFRCLAGISERISQNTLAEICCLFMEKHYSRWYIDAFRFIAQCININKMDNEHAQMLIHCIIGVIKNDQERQVLSDSSFLIVLRKQNLLLTKELNIAIKGHMPRFYYGDYKLETTTNRMVDFPLYVQNYTKRIHDSNLAQGKGGLVFVHGTRDIETLRRILSEKGVKYEGEILDSLISALSDTLLVSKESIDIKLDAISLLICIAIKYNEDFMRNENTYKLILEKQDKILDIDYTFMWANIDKTSLCIALSLLRTAMGKDGYNGFMEGIAYIQNDRATLISVTQTIIKYLEIDNDVVFPQRIEIILLQNVLQWLVIDDIDVKYNATRILILLIRNPENKDIINQKIINLIDTESLYIKNLIMRQLDVNNITDDTREYVLSKCQHDSCYVVRQVCEEVREKLEKRKALPTHKSHDSDVPKSTVSAQE